MTFSQLAEDLGAELIGKDLEFSSLSTDTRSLAAGDVYLALTGENFDGNKFVDVAEQNGAVGAIVSSVSSAGISQLKVRDTHEALGRIASLGRQRSEARVIALTGSQGKTTVKEMLGSILANNAETLATHANLNNTIGVPLTLLQLNEKHRFVVIEMGANRAGEIAFSTEAAKPDMALITNASAAHIEGFGSLQGIVQAKGEIIDGVAADGVVLLNCDDPHVEAWIERAGNRQVVLFAYGNESGRASYFASKVRTDRSGTMNFILNTPQGERELSIQLLGKHNVFNAVAASAAALEAGANLQNVADGLAAMAPVSGRMNPLVGINDSTVVDDTYNASPSSFYAAIDVLMSFPGKKILVAGDMKELGVESDDAHSAVGKYAKDAGVDELWTVGESSELTARAFGKHAVHFEDKASLIDACKKIASADVVFLIKGSRGARMDELVNKLASSEDI